MYYTGRSIDIERRTLLWTRLAYLLVVLAIHVVLTYFSGDLIQKKQRVDMYIESG